MDSELPAAFGTCTNTRGLLSATVLVTDMQASASSAARQRAGRALLLGACFIGAADAVP